MIPFLPLNRINAAFEPELSEAISRVVKSGWYLRGKETENFEKEFAEFCGMQHCAGVASGLDALIMIFAAYKILGKLNDGDHVIVPANTYIASIMAISKNNLIPVLAEPSEETFNINANKLSDYLTPKTKAILAVHLYGRQCEKEILLKFAKENNLLLIEDSAQSAGIKPFGDAAAFSFYPGKNLGALGDGGAVVSNNGELDSLIRMLGNYGSEKKYINGYLGFNSRLDEIQAAALSVKLKKLNEHNKKRNEIAMRYIVGAMTNVGARRALPLRLSLPLHDDNISNVWHLFVIRSKQRDALQKHLFEKGIETLIHYPVPPHLQKAYKGGNLIYNKLPITEALANEVLSIPLHQAMSDEEIEKVCGALRAV
ncbi:MAG: DegT/DnrJ/EryC1/StrS family aminotransferase [Fibromonadaceae bacterium]|jgi:dTDP-4-amino-4,6-dideoxygalactose transaminase|nr:DegT/DnrJ/EryC1/StrS family aminotransferase [Fibromonadaceae bacterium]